MGGNDRPAAMILGGHYQSLGAARNLAKHGVRVYVADDEVCVTQFSRSVRRSFRAPPVQDEESWVIFLEQLAQDPAMSDCVLFPSTDETVKLLAFHRERLSRCYRVTVPDWETTRFLYDKRLTHRLAVQQDVPAPGTWNPANTRELASLDIRYPVVLKPAVSTHLSAVTHKKAYRVNDERELMATYELMARIMDPSEILVQELIPGRAESLYSYFGYFKQGKLVTGHAAKRPRQHPMEFGRASTYAVTVDLPELADLAVRLLSGIDFTGLAEVEFMYDSQDARFELIEVNPRIWGWHALAMSAGVDLPYIAYADAIQQDFKIGRYRDNVKWTHLTTDIPTAAVEIWNGRMSIGQYVKSLLGSTDAVLSLRDPLPYLVELFLIPYFTMKRGY